MGDVEGVDILVVRLAGIKSSWSFLCCCLSSWGWDVPSLDCAILGSGKKVLRWVAERVLECWRVGSWDGLWKGDGTERLGVSGEGGVACEAVVCWVDAP